jgi:hypothetical protein
MKPHHHDEDKEQRVDAGSWIKMQGSKWLETLCLEQVCFFFLDFYIYSTNYLQVVLLSTYEYHHPSTAHYRPSTAHRPSTSTTSTISVNHRLRRLRRWLRPPTSCHDSLVSLQAYGSFNSHQRVTTTRWWLYGDYDGDYDHQRVTTTRWCLVRVYGPTAVSTAANESRRLVGDSTTSRRRPRSPTSHDDSLVSLRRLRRHYDTPLGTWDVSAPRVSRYIFF